MNTSALSALDAEILEAVVAADDPSLPLPLAEALLTLSLNSDQRREIESLLERNSEGTISSSERAKLEACIRVGNFLSLLQAKARTTVQRPGKS